MSKHNGKRSYGKPMKPGGKGRPSLITPEIVTQIVQGVRTGCYIATAAAIAGIGKQTAYNWLTRGQDEEDTIYADLFDRVQHAQVQSEADDLATIGKASEEDWTAAAWRLERKYPEKFGKRTRIENVNVTTLDELPQGEADLFDLDRLSVPELERLREIVAKLEDPDAQDAPAPDAGDNGHDPDGNGTPRLLPPPPQDPIDSAD